jgi:hypothetical protein
MAEALNTFADFLGEFPSEPNWAEDPALEPPGRHVTNLIVKRLRERGFDIQNVETVGYGYIIECESRSRPLTVSIWADDPWNVMRWNVECPHCGPWWARFTSHPDQYAHRRLVMAVHEILLEHQGIRDIRWFPAYDSPGNLKDRNADASPVPRAKNVS